MLIVLLKITYKTTDNLHISSFKGSVLRGAFGYAFKKIACPIKNKICQDCLLKHKCVYSYIFETPRPEDSEIMRKYENIPHPFIFEPPINNKREYKKDANFSFNLIIIGKAIDYLPYFIYALEEMGNNGLGENRGKLQLISVSQGRNIIYNGQDKTLKSDVKRQQLNIRTAFKPVNKITIKFQTPFRIRYQGKLAQSLDFHILIRNLIRRIGLLSYFYSDTPFKIDFNSIIKRAEKIRTQNSVLNYQDLSRYSTRQEQRIPMGGYLGEITYQGNLTEFIPYLKIGEMVHLGKGTVFGLGKFKIKRL